MSRPHKSWGQYPYTAQEARDCVWQDQIADTRNRLTEIHRTTLAIGNARSYGDVGLAASGHALQMRGLNKFISADWHNGILRAEAGVTLGETIEQALPKGWFLEVTPGTKFVTLGGAIANDVHGKNHHKRGTFGRYVRRFRLIRSDTAPLECAPDQNTELFAATIGGLGLTGIIEWVEIALKRVKSNSLTTHTKRFQNLKEFFALSDELDHKHEYSVAWIDALASGKSKGRGIYITADHADDGALTYRPPSHLTVPVTPPFSLINPLSARLFNSFYWRNAPANKTARQNFEPYFYPLDRLGQWNRIYGRKGFQQFQCVIPERNAEPAMETLVDAITQSGLASFLVVLKRCGGATSPGLMSFPMQGTSLALDFPQSVRLNEKLFPRLDAVVHEAGGRLYPAKDAHMSAAHFRAAYPTWHEVERLRDPALISLFWKRVTA